MSNALAMLGGAKVRTKPFAVHPVVGEEERREVLEVLETGVLSGFVATATDAFYGGPKIGQLEHDFAAYFGSKHAVAVNSATAGLHAALAALGIGPGDEVIVPPYTMSASATSILMQNAIPVFADIEEETFCLDPAAVERAVTPRTKAIVVVHLFGHPADMAAIMAVAKRHNLSVVEDCAQAPAAVYEGDYVGTIGDVGVFSLNQHKTVTTGEGGVVITDDDDLALRVQLVRNHGEVVVDAMGVQDTVNMLGWNYRMTELEAAVGVAQFSKLERLTTARIELAEYLKERLAGFDGLTLPTTRPQCRHVYFVFPIRFNAERVGIDRAVFVEALVAEGIPFAAGYVRPIYLEPTYQRQVGYGSEGCPYKCAFYHGRVDYRQGLCPVTERMYRSELILTGLCRYPMQRHDMDDIVRAFDKVYSNAEALRDYERVHAGS